MGKEISVMIPGDVALVSARLRNRTGEVAVGQVYQPNAFKCLARSQGRCPYWDSEGLPSCRECPAPKNTIVDIQRACGKMMPDYDFSATQVFKDGNGHPIPHFMAYLVLEGVNRRVPDLTKKIELKVVGDKIPGGILEHSDDRPGIEDRTPGIVLIKAHPWGDEDAQHQDDSEASAETSPKRGTGFLSRMARMFGK